MLNQFVSNDFIEVGDDLGNELVLDERSKSLSRLFVTWLLAFFTKALSLTSFLKTKSRNESTLLKSFEYFTHLGSTTIRL